MQYHLTIYIGRFPECWDILRQNTILGSKSISLTISSNSKKLEIPRNCEKVTHSLLWLLHILAQDRRNETPSIIWANFLLTSTKMQYHLKGPFFCCYFFQASLLKVANSFCVWISGSSKDASFYSTNPMHASGWNLGIKINHWYFNLSKED